MIRHENENGSVNVSTGVYTGIVGTAAWFASKCLHLRKLTDHHGIDIDIHRTNLGAGTFGHHVAHLGND